MIFNRIDEPLEYGSPLTNTASDFAEPRQEPGWFTGVFDAIWGGVRSAGLESLSAAQGVVSELKIGDDAYRARLDMLAKENRYEAALEVPDPETTSRAASLVYGVTNGMTKIGMSAPALMIPGPLGPVAAASLFGAQMGINRTQTLKDQGVDDATAKKAGLASGVMNTAWSLVPGAVGARVATRAATGAALGAFTAASENAAIHTILQNADYSKVAEQFDPFNLEDVAINAVVGGVMGGIMPASPRRADPTRYHDESGKDVTVEVEDAARVRAEGNAAAANLPVEQENGAKVEAAKQEQFKARQQLNRGKAVQMDAYSVDAERIKELHKVAVEKMAKDAADGKISWQNRARTSKESISQMNEIAAHPDYYRVATGHQLSDGAPVVAYGEAIPEVQLGREETIVDSQGVRYQARYAVVDADRVLTSNQVDGTPNPLYAVETVDQPKAVAGNGRIAGLAEGYRRGTMDQYRADFLADKSHGIDPTVIRDMERPILVRLVHAEELPPDIGDRSNQRSTSDLSMVEQAMTDAQRIDYSRLSFTEDGNVGVETMAEFLRQLPQAERNGLMVNGVPSDAAYRRLDAAIFQAAYQNPALTSLLDARSAPGGIGTLLRSLRVLAPRVVGLDGSGDLDFRPILGEVLNEVQSSRAAGKGMPLAELASQMSMTRTPEAQAVLDFLASNEANKGGYQGIVGVFTDLADFAKAAMYSEAQGAGLFGENQKPTRLDLMREFSRASGIKINEAEFRPAENLADVVKTDQIKKLSQSAEALANELNIPYAGKVSSSELNLPGEEAVKTLGYKTVVERLRDYLKRFATQDEKGRFFISSSSGHQVEIRTKGLKKGAIQARVSPYFHTHASTIPAVIHKGQWSIDPLYKTRLDGIKQFHRITAVVELDGKPVVESVKVAEDTQGRFYYFLEEPDTWHKNKGAPDQDAPSRADNTSVDQTVEQLSTLSSGLHSNSATNLASHITQNRQSVKGEGAPDQGAPSRVNNTSVDPTVEQLSTKTNGLHSNGATYPRDDATQSRVLGRGVSDALNVEAISGEQAGAIIERAEDVKRQAVIEQALEQVRKSTADNTLQKQAAVQALEDDPQMTLQIDGEDSSIAAAEFVAREEARADELMQKAERGTTEAVICAVLNNGI